MDLREANTLKDKNNVSNNKQLVESDKNNFNVTSPVSPEDKQILRDRMKEMFTKIITDIDTQVLTVSESQCELDSQLDRLITTLDSIKIDEKLTDEIKANARRIASLKERLTLIHTILSNSSARCSRTLAACGSAVSSLNPPSTVNIQFAAPTGSANTGSQNTMKH